PPFSQPAASCRPPKAAPCAASPTKSRFTRSLEWQWQCVPYRVPSFVRTWKSTCESRAPLVVMRQNGEPVVVISLAEYEALEETLHLLRDPANAQRLLRSIREAEAGQLVEHDIRE